MHHRALLYVFFETKVGVEYDWGLISLFCFWQPFFSLKLCFFPSVSVVSSVSMNVACKYQLLPWQINLVFNNNSAWENKVWSVLFQIIMGCSFTLRQVLPSAVKTKSFTGKRLRFKSIRVVASAVAERTQMDVRRLFSAEATCFSILLQGLSLSTKTGWLKLCFSFSVPLEILKIPMVYLSYAFSRQKKCFQGKWITATKFVCHPMSHFEPSRSTKRLCDCQHSRQHANAQRFSQSVTLKYVVDCRGTCLRKSIFESCRLSVFWQSLFVVTPRKMFKSFESAWITKPCCSTFS